jgi:diguanylate cyclase (GGDEF)-like protein/PAS domain S-box-containing protein
MHADSLIARSLTWRYVVALTLVAMLTTAAWLSLHLVISEQQSSAALVNVSGRQRMLSQRTALFSSLLANAPKEKRAEIRSQLQQAAELMQRSHRGLVHGDAEMGLPDTMSATVRAMYFEQPLALNNQVGTYLATMQALLRVPDAELRPDHPLVQYVITVSPSRLVSSLDKMVSQYQLEGETAVSRLQTAETIVWLITLLLLALEAAFIFHPFARQIRIVIGKLEGVTESLRRSQDELEERVRQRTMDLEQTSKELADSEERFRLISTSAQDAIVIIDQSEIIVYWNPAAAAMFGYPTEQAIGRNMHDLLAPSRYRKDIDRGFGRFRETGSGPLIGRTVEVTAMRCGGEEFPIELSISTLMLDGQTHALGIIRDISERKRAEENLRINASVFDTSQEAIIITDTDNLITDVNPAFTRITGYSREDVLGRNPKLLSSGRHDSAFYAEMWQSIQQNKAWRGEIWNRRKSGEIYAELLSITAICDRDGKVQRHVGLFSDISHIKEHEAELNRIAHFDALTGIPNRSLLIDRMKQAIAQTRREQNMMAVCYLDLDGFKHVNDTLGHEAGDQVLVEESRRIGHTIRGGDTVARLGGDEFVVLLQGLEKGEECVATLERLLAAVAQPILIKDQNCMLSASIGVSIYPLDDEEPYTLLRHADQAMYVAKQSGKNRFYIYDPALDLRARSRDELLKGIRLALERNEFELHYQPKVDLRTRQLVGAEALIRWRHPERGLLSPAEFLPAIENTDLDIAIGDWVIASALEQVSLWRNAGLDIEVSVNISAYHLESPGFAGKVRQQLAQHPELPPGRLQIEVLETTALEDTAIVREVIEACRQFGLRFALDDFGTGYSSLSYLSNLPVDVLKIDQSFVRNMLDDKGAMAIVHGIIALAQAFEREIVAEGIETGAHYRALLDLGCEFGQGYGITRPMPADKLTGWRFE